MKAILFDLDGVLIDTEWIYNKCWKTSSAELGFELSDEQILSLRSCDKTVAAELYGGVENYLKVRERRKALMDEMIPRDPIKLKYGVHELMDFLKKTSLTTAVVTATPLDRAVKYLKDTGIYGEFDHVVSAKQVERGKPFPDVYLFACKELGVSPADCYAVEDSPNGLRSARDAGCVTVMVPDLTPCDDSVRKYVDYCVSDLTDIKFIVE